jgi:hypothetical protein
MDFDPKKELGAEARASTQRLTLYLPNWFYRIKHFDPPAGG